MTPKSKAIAPRASYLKAAATRLGRMDKSTKQQRPSDYNRRSRYNSEWQTTGWDMYDVVGELRFLATNLAGQAGKSLLYLGKDTGEDTPEHVSKGRFEGILDGLGGSVAGRGEMIERLFLNLYIAGEGWLVGIPFWDAEAGAYEEPESIDDYDWKMLSISEVSTNQASDEITLNLEDGSTAKFDAEDIYLIRVWRGHPRRSWEADSPVRSALPILKELVGLTMHISAQVDSRLAGAGLLVVPQSAQRALAVAAGQEDPDGGETDEFTDALVEAMLTPIADRESASAVVTLVVTVPDEAVNAFNHISFSTPLDGEARELRDEAIRRLALSMDAPPELLLGTGGMNHWGGWLVQEETVRSHIEPTLGLICNALTTQYLWPLLEEQGLDPDEAREYVIHYEVDHLISRPNQTQDAFALHEKGALSDDALRRVSGFDDSDKPERPVDLATSTALEMVRANPQLLVNPGAEALVDYLRGLISGNFTSAPDDSQEDSDPDTGPADGEGVSEAPEADDGPAGERPAAPTSAPAEIG